MVTMYDSFIEFDLKNRCKLYHNLLNDFQQNGFDRRIKGKRQREFAKEVHDYTIMLRQKAVDE